MKGNLETMDKVFKESNENRRIHNAAILFWKALFILGGLGIFIWGIVNPYWIRMIGGIVLLFLGMIINTD